MRTTLCLLVSLVLGMGSGCDSADDPPSSLVGTYALVEVSGAALPSGGITSGQLRLRIEETIPSYTATWFADGVREDRGGTFSVEGSTVEFVQTSGGELRAYVGRVTSRQIRVTFADLSFTFQKD